MAGDAQAACARPASPPGPARRQGANRRPGARAVVHVDPARCLGCGQCLPSCPRGLLVIRGQQACLADAGRCDGRGVCLGHCSADALSLLPLSASSRGPWPGWP